MAKYTKTKLSQFKAVEIKKIASEMNIKYNNKKETILKILEKQSKSFPPISTGTIEFDNKESQETQSPKTKTSIDLSTFLIQVDKSNIFDYFASALIYPANYETREFARKNRTKDVQEFLAPNHLLISDGFTDEPNENQVLIEVSLSKTDKQNLEKLNEKIYLLPYPLPISRVNKIYFASEESQLNSIATAKTFQDAFLPKHLFEIWDDKIERRINFVEEINPSKIPTNKFLKTEEQDYFNRVLGMLAFMKNAELYYTNETYKFANHSENYFKVLRLINSFFAKREVGELDRGNLIYYSALLKSSKFSSKTSLQKIVQAIYDNQTFKREIFKQLLGTPKHDVQSAFKLLVGDETLKALGAIDQLYTPAPELVLLAFLYRFRDKEGSDKFALKEQIPYLINRQILDDRTLNRANIVLATLGLYYGYRSLPKEEEIQLKDTFFASLSENDKFHIKYKLNNLFDRITIESVFQYCFFGINNCSFEYLKDDTDAVKYQLPDGYNDSQSFAIENYPIIRIHREHTKRQKEVKSETKGIFGKVKSFLNTLKKNGLAQGELKLDENKFDNWLYSNSLSELEKALSQFKQNHKDEFTND